MKAKEMSTWTRFGSVKTGAVQINVGKLGSNLYFAETLTCPFPGLVRWSDFSLPSISQPFYLSHYSSSNSRCKKTSSISEGRIGLIGCDLWPRLQLLGLKFDKLSNTETILHAASIWQNWSYSQCDNWSTYHCIVKDNIWLLTPVPEPEQKNINAGKIYV